MRPSKGSEQESVFGEEASSEEDSRDNSSVPSSKTETAEDYLDERTTTVGEGEYEHTSQLAPSFPLICSISFSFFCIFHLSLPYISISPVFTKVNFSSRGKDRLAFGFVFSRPNHSCPSVLSASS